MEEPKITIRGQEYFLRPLFYRRYTDNVLDFTANEIQYIEDEAERTYPLTVQVNTGDDEPRIIQTTKLIDVLDLANLLAGYEPHTYGLESIVEMFSESKYSFYVQTNPIEEGENNIIQLLWVDYIKKIQQIHTGDLLVVDVEEIFNASMKLRIMEMTRRTMQYHNLDIEWVDIIIRQLNRMINPPTIAIRGVNFPLNKLFESRFIDGFNPLNIPELTDEEDFNINRAARQLYPLKTHIIRVNEDRNTMGLHLTSLMSPLMLLNGILPVEGLYPEENTLVSAFETILSNKLFYTITAPPHYNDEPITELFRFPENTAMLDILEIYTEEMRIELRANISLDEQIQLGDSMLDILNLHNYELSSIADIVRELKGNRDNFSRIFVRIHTSRGMLRRMEEPLKIHKNATFLDLEILVRMKLDDPNIIPYRRLKFMLQGTGNPEHIYYADDIKISSLPIPGNQFGITIMVPDE